MQFYTEQFNLQRRINAVLNALHPTEVGDIEIVANLSDELMGAYNELQLMFIDSELAVYENRIKMIQI